ncbi:MAG: hypothetical protein H6937_02660 [Burkholderiales bacterium]|nr:hypothetical protein [Burkholderiales bacterium]
MKKSRKIAEDLPHVVDQAETVIFLYFEGNKNPFIFFITCASSGAANLYLQQSSTGSTLLPVIKVTSINHLRPLEKRRFPMALVISGE